MNNHHRNCKRQSLSFLISATLSALLLCAPLMATATPSPDEVCAALKASAKESSSSKQRNVIPHEIGSAECIEGPHPNTIELKFTGGHRSVYKIVAASGGKSYSLVAERHGRMKIREGTRVMVGDVHAAWVPPVTTCICCLQEPTWKGYVPATTCEKWCCN